MGLIYTVWMVIALGVLLRLADSFVGPVPMNYWMEQSANGSLRVSAPDLARFLIELARPEHPDKDVHAEIGTVQVRDNDDFSWGLGIDIQHSANGDALWQNGDTFAFRSMMVTYPEKGHGIVVLTNSASGMPVAYDVAARTLGGKSAWKQF